VYSYKLTNELDFLRRIVTSIRKCVPIDFILGVKVNACDYLDRPSGAAGVMGGDREARGGIGCQKTQESRALEHIRTMASWHMIDFIEISGGDYETPGMNLKFLN
jgi:2,4-dienoyl-CoA reductase-like NADH-dependent reductase (Old Yellow Enzyme family)